MKLAIIREGKVPPDSRVLFTPEQCVALQEKYNIQFVVQPSEGRCLPDKTYREAGILVQEDISDCEVYLGIKEVPKKQLVANKSYFFFSHTIKAQPYNKALLQKILQENITLYDYEVLTNEKKQRVIAFGRFAGIVGAHNGMMTYGNRAKAFELQQMHKYDDYAEAIDYYKTLSFPTIKIVVTGKGRVGNGAAEVFDHMGIKKVSPQDFLSNDYNEAVYTQLDCIDYVEPKDNKKAFERLDFFKNPKDYKSTFDPYIKVADLMVNGIYWANEAPVFFSKEDMQSDDFKIQVIADVTCDIAPVASIPSTLFATTIAQPVFGYDPMKEEAVDPYQDHTIDMMTIDNLPNELPKDASKSFGEQFIEHVIEELLGIKDTGMLRRAMIAHAGKLGPNFQYLTDYVKD